MNMLMQTKSINDFESDISMQIKKDIDNLQTLNENHNMNKYNKIAQILREELGKIIAPNGEENPLSSLKGLTKASYKPLGDDEGIVSIE